MFGPTVLIFIALFNSMLGLSVLFPVLAPLGRELSLTEVQVGLLSTAYALTQFLASPWWGRRSERVGRKPVLLAGIIGFAFAFTVFGVAAQVGLSGRLRPGIVFGLLIGARLLGGLFASATIPTAQAYVADLTAREARVSGMAVVGAAMGMGLVFGPALGAALAQVHLLAPIWFSAGTAVVNALFVALWLPEPPRAGGPSQVIRLWPVARRVWRLLGVALAINLSAVAMQQTVAFYYQDRLNLDAPGTARAVGYALMLYGAVAVVAQVLLVRRQGMRARVLLLAGLPFGAVGLLLLVFADGFWPLTLSLALQGFGQGMIMPGLTASLSLTVSDQEQGAVAGINGSVQSFGRMLGPVVGAGLYQLHPELPYLFGGSLLGLVWLFLWTQRAGRLAH